jgi:hypothetical protein
MRRNTTSSIINTSVKMASTLICLLVKNCSVSTMFSAKRVLRASVFNLISLFNSVHRSFQIFCYALRPGFVRNRTSAKWHAYHLLTHVAFDILVRTFGYAPLIYLVMSSFVAGSFHLRRPFYRRTLSMGQSGTGNVQLLGTIKLARLQCLSFNDCFTW